MRTKHRYIFSLLILVLSSFSVSAQYFPPASSLMTGQGTPGGLDPVWTVSSQWYTSGIPTAADLNADVFSPALINNSCAPGAWVDPGSLPSPNNLSNWITGADVDCGNNYGWGYRAFRMILNLPSDCNGVSVTQPGTYILNLLAYADNSIAEVYINGIATGISGGNYSPSGGVNISLSGPWLVGNNTVDIVVLNDYNGDLNPYGLLVTSNTANVTDTDNDGVDDNTDLCPCTPGNNTQGCITNTFGCDMNLIQANIENANLIPLAKSNSPCKLYYLDTVQKTSTAAQIVADGINGSLAVINSAALMNSLVASIQEVVPGGQAYFGLNDVAVEGTFVYPNGEPVVYTNWNPGEPNNQGDEDCVEILPNGTMNDIPCSTLRYAVYEIDLCPTLTITPSIQVCYNTAVVVDATVTNGSLSYTYDWSTGETTPGITVIATAPTNVSVIINDENFCHDTTDMDITLFPSEPKGINSSVASTGNNGNGDPIYVLCEGDAITLTAFGGSGYTWSNGMTNGTSFVPAAGTNSLTCIFTNIHGCQDSVKAEAQVNPLPTVDAGPDVALCSDDVYVLNATGAVSYVWSNGQTNGSNYNQVIGTTQLIVTGTDANSCSKNDTILITVNALPTVTVNDAAVCNGIPASLTASGADTYSWSPATDLNTTTGPNVISSTTSATSYTVTGTNANGCVSTAVSNVTINSLPTAALTAPTSVCQNDAATLTGSGGTTYEWLAPASLAGTTNTVATEILTTTTTYTLVAFNTAGCSDTISAVVTVNPLPTVTVNSGTMCFGTSLDLNASGAVTYSWSPSTSLSGSSGSPVTATPSATTIYTVTGTDANGCSSSATSTVTVNPLPTITVNSETMCKGETSVLQASGAVSYVWSPAADLSASTGSTVVSSATSTTTYTVTGTDANGCQNQATSTVTISPDPTLTIPSDQTICYGQTISLNAVSNGTVEWDGYSNNAQLTPSVGAHTYSVTATSAFGCVVSDQFTVNVAPLPESNFVMSPDSLTIYTPEISFINTSTGGSSYQWFFGDGSSSNAFNPQHIYDVDPLTDHSVTLITVSANGCVDTTVHYLPKNMVLVHFIPNTFTPDGDENNNDFLPIFGPGYDEYSYTLYIFNRWGEILFESHKMDQGWDGTYHGELAPTGTYLWKIRIKEIGVDNWFDYIGSVSLIR